MARVVEINDLDCLAGYRLLWNSLLGQTPGANYFQSLDWLMPYWRHFGAAGRLRVLVVYSADRPIGILPLVCRREALRFGAVEVITYPLDDWGTFFAPIGPNPTATLLAGLGHLRRTEADWDVLDLRWVDTAGSDRGRTAAAMATRGFPATARPWSTVAQIHFDGSWEQYLAGRDRRWRKNLRYAERRLAQRGKISYQRCRPRGAAWGDDDPQWHLYDACERVAGASWQAQSRTGTTLTHPCVQAFLRDAHESAARAGAADINLLLIADEPVAFAYGYHYQGSVFGLRNGYDSVRASEGAGMVLMARMIEDGFERGDRLLDLGADYLECKRHWMTDLLTSYHYAHYRAGAPLAQALRFKRWLAGVRGKQLQRNTKEPATT